MILIKSLEEVKDLFFKEATRYVEVHKKVNKAKNELHIIPKDKGFVVDKDGNKVMTIELSIWKEVTNFDDDGNLVYKDFVDEDGKKATKESYWGIYYSIQDCNKAGAELWAEDYDNEAWFAHNRCEYLEYPKSELPTTVTKDIMEVLWYDIECEIKGAFEGYLTQINAGEIEPNQHPVWEETECYKNIQLDKQKEDEQTKEQSEKKGG